MADIKISQLGAAIAVGDTDLLPIVSGGNTLKATAAQVKEHSIGNTNISSIGNGSVTGAISALNTDKQPKTLDTPLTIGGVSKTTVEAALGGLVSENQTLANDIAYVNTNLTTASKGYSEGEQFILNGVLKVATANISSGATLNNSNCQDSDDIVTQIAEKVTIKKATVNAHSTYTYDLEDGAYIVASTGSFSSLLALSIGVGYGAGDTRNKLSAIIPASDTEIAFVAEPSYFGVRCANSSDYPITFYLIQ